MFLTFLSLILLIFPMQCAQVLVVFNPVIFSHSLLLNRTVNSLLKYNHTFTFLHIPLHENVKTLRGISNFSHTVIDDLFTEAETAQLTDIINHQMFSSNSSIEVQRNWKAYEKYGEITKITAKLCQLFILDSFLAKLRRFSYDFVILDSYAAVCIRRIPDIVNAPFIEPAIASLSPRQAWEIGCPIPISYVAYDVFSFSGWGPISFTNRIINSFDIIVSNLLGFVYMQYQSTRNIANGFKKFIEYSNLDSNVSGFVLNDHPYFLPPRPTLHSLQFSLRSSQSDDNQGSIDQDFLYLDQHLKLNNYKGIIIISMSTLWDDLPEDFVLSVLNSIIHFDRYYFVWKYPKVFPKITNVKTANYLPLEYLLKKKQTKLIITHAGRNTLHEAVINAVPIIAFTQGFDHNTNLKRIGKYGTISAVKLETIDYDVMKTTIIQMLSCNIAKAAHKLKTLYLDTIVPRDNAAHFINKLIQRHPQKIMTPTGHNFIISFYFNFDIMFLALGICITFIVIIA